MLGPRPQTHILNKQKHCLKEKPRGWKEQEVRRRSFIREFQLHLGRAGAALRSTRPGSGRHRATQAAVGRTHRGYSGQLSSSPTIHTPPPMPLQSHLRRECPFFFIQDLGVTCARTKPLIISYSNIPQLLRNRRVNQSHPKGSRTRSHCAATTEGVCLGMEESGLCPRCSRLFLAQERCVSPAGSERGTQS